MKESLSAKLYNFIQTFGIIPTDTIISYFKNYDDKDIKWNLKTLKMDGRIWQIESNTITCINQASSKLSVDNETITAIRVMESFNCDDVDYYFKLSTKERPKQITFVCKEKLYDVSVITEKDKFIEMAILENQLLTNADESINIVVVENKETGKNLFKYGYDAYCMFNSENEPVFYQE